MTSSLLLHIRVPLFIGIGIILFGVSDGLDSEQCRAALGMGNDKIRNESITASSFSDPQFGPASARIRRVIDGLAWCPEHQISKDVYEYLEVDLGALHVITSIETQGGIKNGRGDEYVEQYKLEYQREDGKRWFKFKDRRGQEIFNGNANTTSSEKRAIDPPIIARKIRVVPYMSFGAKHVCLRIELYGCIWRDGIVSYEMPQGQRLGKDVELHDATYDGDTIGKVLVGGLGQLVDGEFGHSNFKLDPDNIGIKGYPWIGWKHDINSSDEFVEILFKFDAVRNFTTLKIHSNNMFSKDVRVFKMARIEFSVTGNIYSSPVEYTYFRDIMIEFPRYVVIPLEHRIGKFVRVRLYFDAKWIMISEVQFDSEYDKEDDITEVKVNTSSCPASAVATISFGVGNELSSTSALPPSNSEPDEEHFGTSKAEKSRSGGYLSIIIIGVIVTVVLQLPPGLVPACFASL